MPEETLTQTLSQGERETTKTGGYAGTKASGAYDPARYAERDLPPDPLPAGEGETDAAEDAPPESDA